MQAVKWVVAKLQGDKNFFFFCKNMSGRKDFLPLLELTRRGAVKISTFVMFFLEITRDFH